jgi:stearoyl-CoA desaturase (delta-9 desaturase)
MQLGPLWWAATHRIHHRYSDKPGDVHSPKQDGLWWAHIGWVLADTGEKISLQDKDFDHPELRWLEKHHWVPGILLAAVLLATGGWSRLLVAFFLGTALLYHNTFLVNSLAHTWGWQDHETGDTSRNNPFIAMMTMGEGWHNDHHHYQSAMFQGDRWWKKMLDTAGVIIWSAQIIGLTKSIRYRPKAPSR